MFFFGSLLVKSINLCAHSASYADSTFCCTQTHFYYHYYHYELLFVSTQNHTNSCFSSVASSKSFGAIQLTKLEDECEIIRIIRHIALRMFRVYNWMIKTFACTFYVLSYEKTKKIGLLYIVRTVQKSLRKQLCSDLLGEKRMKACILEILFYAPKSPRRNQTKKKDEYPT